VGCAVCALPLYREELGAFLIDRFSKIPVLLCKQKTYYPFIIIFQPRETPVSQGHTVGHQLHGLEVDARWMNILTRETNKKRQRASRLCRAFCFPYNLRQAHNLPILLRVSFS